MKCLILSDHSARSCCCAAEWMQPWVLFLTHPDIQHTCKHCHILHLQNVTGVTKQVQNNM